MKQSCPKCKTLIEINEKEYFPGSTVVKPCPLCDGKVTFNIPDKKATDEEAITKLNEEVEALKKQLNDIQSNNEKNKAAMAAKLKAAEDRAAHAESLAKQPSSANTGLPPQRPASPKNGKAKKNNTGAWIWGAVAIMAFALLVLLISIRGCSHHDEVIDDKSKTATTTIDSPSANTGTDNKSMRSQGRDTIRQFPDEEIIKDVIGTYLNAQANNDFNSLYETYAPMVEKFHDASYLTRSEVLAKEQRYDSVFQVYGKYSAVMWETFRIEWASSNRVAVIVVEKFDIDRVDKNKLRHFVLEKHITLNDDYQIVSVWDNQLSAKK